MAQKNPAATSPLLPNASLLAKIGSIIVHVEEGCSIHGHHFDWGATTALIAEPEVQAWLDAMRAQALVPVARNAKIR